jgi:FixJ family two-component response regulator
MTDAVVFLIDDDPGVRRGVSRLLRSRGRQVQAYGSAKDFLDQPLPSGPACIVLDLQMPEMNGLEVQQVLGQSKDTLPIVFISGRGSIPASVRAMKEGAVDFLTKPFEDDQLLRAIDTALARAREAFVRRDALDRDCAIFDTLSQREKQVCLRVAQGMLNKQIGGEFGTTEKTVKVQRSGVMKKLGAQSAADVVRFVERLRIAGRLPPPPKLPGN